MGVCGSIVIATSEDKESQLAEGVQVSQSDRWRLGWMAEVRMRMSAMVVHVCVVSEATRTDSSRSKGFLGVRNCTQQSRAGRHKMGCTYD